MDRKLADLKNSCEYKLIGFSSTVMTMGAATWGDRADEEKEARS